MVCTSQTHVSDLLRHVARSCSCRFIARVKKSDMEATDQSGGTMSIT